MFRKKDSDKQKPNQHANLAITNSQFGDVGGDVQSHNKFKISTKIYKYDSARPLLEYLQHLANHEAPYDSLEREKEGASICTEKTREDVLAAIRAWAGRRDPQAAPICWVSGSAGAGKTAIAHTIATEYDEQHQLAFSYFFSRRNKNRNNINEFIPTFAYKLATTIPSIQPFMRSVLEKTPDVFTKRLGDQLGHVVIDSLQSLPEPPSLPLLVVVDGLDEYSDEDGGIALRDILRLLIDNLPSPLFRILLTSRPEGYIQDIFQIASFKSRISTVLLRDYPADDDIRRYLEEKLSEVARKRHIPTPWPCSHLLYELSRKSEGIFIYASTLVKFVDNEYEHPEVQLEIAMKAHKGLDSLYVQVLESARKYKNFERVLGAVAFARHPSITILPALLQLHSVEEIMFGLRGCLSILVVPVPGDEDDYIRPYHASFMDFLGDPQRGKDQFVKTLEWNMDLVIQCSNYIRAGGRGGARLYVDVNWCSHFLLAVSSTSHLADLESIMKPTSLLIEHLLARLQSWFINMGSYEVMQQVQRDVEAIIHCLNVSRFRSKIHL